MKEKIHEIKNILSDSIAILQSGTANYYINFEKRSLRIGGKDIIKDGRMVEDDCELGIYYENMNDALECIERQYEIYYHSVPTERTEKKRKTYFKALGTEELTDEDFIRGDRRNIEMFILEYYVLVLAMSGFEWTDDMGKWFWHSKKNTELVILKKWIEIKNKE